MTSWSSVCSLTWGRTMTALLFNNLSTKHAPAERLVSIYYLSPAANEGKNPDKSLTYYQTLKKSIPPSTATVYPLSLEDFGNCLWQSSAKLLVLSEDICHSALNFQFSTQVELVSQYLAGGGRVILMLHNSAKNGHRQESTSLWSMVNTANSLQCPVEKADCSLWSWKHVVDKTGRHGLLIGDPSKSMNSSPTHRLVVICADAVTESDGRVLHEALNLVGVDNRHNDIDEGSIRETSDSNILYCLPLLTEYQKTLELIRSVASQPISLLDYLVTDEEAMSSASGFSWGDYSSTLQTRNLGRVLVWAESMQSSWSLTEGLLASLPPNSGLLVTSNLQDGGKGRGSNQWITPLGQAAFTFHLTIEASPTGVDQGGCCVSQSELMQQVVCSQHIVSLAILFTCRRLIGERLGLLPTGVPAHEEEAILSASYEGPQIRIKWPNDVYVVDSHVGAGEADRVLEHSNLTVLGKLAGVLTKASTVGGPERTDVLVGCGVNIANRTPTICLLDVIDQCRTPAVHQQEISIARVIAVFLNQLEHLIDRIRRTSSGLSWALQMYTQCWLHSGQIVDVVSSTQKEPCRCRIVGLDAFGFLQVKDLRDGSVYSLHPDGNSMDMMRGLVRPK